MQTFIDLISKQAGIQPNAIAISHGKKSISYKELMNNMKRVHKGATLAGLKKGDNVLFICKPDIEGLSLALGLLHTGITVSIIDPFTADDLFLNRTKSARATHVIAHELLYTLSKYPVLVQKFMRRQLANINTLNVEKLIFGRIFPSKKTDGRKWLSNPVPAATSLAEPDVPAIIVFTSGTTSEPKGVVHTFRSLSVSIPATAEALKIRPDSKVYSEPMTVGLVALSMGAEWIIPIPGEDFPNDSNVWFGTPKEILDGLAIIDQSSLSPTAMETVAVGAAPVLPSLVDKIEQAFSHLTIEIKNIYGMTEMLPIAIGDARLKKQLAHLGDYIGEPLPTVEVSIAEDGEVLIAGPSLCAGYSPKPDSDGDVQQLPILGTGDIGEIMENGHVVLKGRKKEMFIRGSMNVYPGLYEPGLSSIEGVKQAVLVGVPDSYGDDVIILAILPEPSAVKDQVKTRVKQQMWKFMDEDAIPSEVILVESLPLSGRANKLDRKALLSEIVNLRNS